MINKEDKSIFNVSKINKKNIITKYDNKNNYMFILINIKTCNGLTRINNGIVQISFMILGTKYIFYSYVRPPDDVPWRENDDFYFTNITKNTVKESPLLENVIKEFYDIITMDNMTPILIGHNISFDKSILEYWFSTYKIKHNNIFWCNTMNSLFFNIKDENGKNIKSLKNIAKTFLIEFNYPEFDNSKRCIEVLHKCLLKNHENNNVIANNVFYNKYNTENKLRIKKEKIDNKYFISDFNNILKNIKEFQNFKVINIKKNEIDELVSKYIKIKKYEEKIIRDKESIKKRIKDILKNKNITDEKINKIINKIDK